MDESFKRLASNPRGRHWRALIWLGLLLTVVAGTAWGQPATTRAASGPASAQAGSQYRVFLMTMGPGEEIWEKFGHDALMIIDTSRETAVAYNYGMFDFEQKHFYINFALGRMQYWMQGFRASWMLGQYTRANRSVWLQELNMTAPQKLKLVQFLEWNERPENKYYHYDYYRDNCTTRVRDALDMAVGGKIKQQLSRLQTERTYRWYTRRVMAENVPLYTVLEFVEGTPTDRTLSAWEETFLPMELQKRLRQVKVLDGHGRTVPLVMSEKVLYTSTRPPVRDEPPRWRWWYLATGIVTAGVLVGLWWLDRVRGVRVARWGMVVAAMAWAFLLGGAGLLLIWMWLFTDHVAVRGNENLLLFNPLAIALVVLLPLACAGRAWAEQAAVGVTGLVVVTTLVAPLLKLLPVQSVYQFNTDLIAWTVPVALALGWVVGRINRQLPMAPAEQKEQPKQPRRKVRGA